MNRDDFLKAFAELSQEDQEAIRAKLLEKDTTGEGTPFDPEQMRKWMSKMMGKMQANGDLSDLCREMKEKMKGKCC